MQNQEDINPFIKLAPYGCTFIFVLSMGNHNGFIGTTQEFISLAVVVKFIHYVAMRTSKISEFLLAQIAIASFYFFIFNSFFRTAAIFLLVYNALFALYIYSHFQEFSDATIEGAFARYKKALAANGFK